jgi:exodeoxyribonuclease VII small subunit
MNPAQEPQTFEAALLELDRIVRDLEDGATGLDVALQRYEQGIGLLKRCYAQLRIVEQRIVELTGKDEAGNAMLRPFERQAPS